MAFPFVPVGVAVAVLGLGYWLVKGGDRPIATAPAVPPTVATPKKNASANKAAGTEYASGKAAGFARGGADAAAGLAEDLNPTADPTATSAAKATTDPDSFLRGYADGYSAGYAAARAASKIAGYSTTTAADEAPPPPPTPPTVPGKPKAYAADPSGAGYNTGYGAGLSYGKGDAKDHAPGSSGALGVKSGDSAAASKTYDGAQMELWSSNWDLGYATGWHTGQSIFHEKGGGEISTFGGGLGSSDEGTTRVEGVSYDGDGSGEAEVCVSDVCRAYGVATRGGWGPRTGAVLAAPQLAARKKLGGVATGLSYNDGLRAGRVFCAHLGRGEVRIDLVDGTGLTSNRAWDQEHADEIVAHATAGDALVRESGPVDWRAPRRWTPSGRRFPTDYVRGFYASYAACRPIPIRAALRT